MSTVSGAKKKTGRPSVDSEAVNVRMLQPMLASLDAWMASQPDPKPTRPEAIRRLLEAALAAQRAPESLDQKIASEVQTIVNNQPTGKPSPKKGMATLRRGLAETKLRSLKASRRGQRKAAEGD